MSDKKMRVLPRLVFAKDKVSKEYGILARNASIGEGELDVFSKIKSKFDWPESDIKTQAVYPDCYGLCRLEEGRYLLLRFRDDGNDEFNRPHTVRYEAALCETAADSTYRVSRFLASFLAPSAWQEADTAVFDPDPLSSINIDLAKSIEKWLTNNNTQLFIAPSTENSSSMSSESERAHEVSSSRSTVDSWPRQNKGSSKAPVSRFCWALCVFLLLIIGGLSVYLLNDGKTSASREEYIRLVQERDELKSKYEKLFGDHEKLKKEEDKLRQRLERIKDVVNE